MKYIGTTDEYFEVLDISNADMHLLKHPQKNELSLLWFYEDNNQMTIDTKPYVFDRHTLLCLTAFHHVEMQYISKLRLLRFNRPFYCILDHDSEVGCKGVLYYGAPRLPILYPSEKDIEVLETVWKMLCIEMVANDELQLEMLQMMLKRILILCTRIYKNQENYTQIETGQADIIREFNFLVEQHFRVYHTVAAYADLLHKSPKTIANIFKKVTDKRPLQFIQERIMLEARRLLRYTDKTISEIGYELGYEDIQSFSRFFKKYEGTSPSEYRIR